jgi:lipoyl(octanoyl) transferase
MEVYKHISEALNMGLGKLASGIDMAKSQPNFQKLYKEPGSVPCFSSSARYEIEFGGRKLVGSAQRRIGKTVLQHGSILIGDAHLRLGEYLSMDDDSASLLRKDLEAQTTTLNDILQRTVTFEEVRDAIFDGFREHWNLEPALSMIVDQEQHTGQRA